MHMWTTLDQQTFSTRMPKIQLYKYGYDAWTIKALPTNFTYPNYGNTALRNEVNELVFNLCIDLFEEANFFRYTLDLSYRQTNTNSNSHTAKNITGYVNVA